MRTEDPAAPARPSSTGTRPGHTGRGALAELCSAIAGSRRFQLAILVIIVANAVTIGLETYSSIRQAHGGLLDALDRVFITIFVVEVTIRVLSYGRRPWQFFTRGWNIFDFSIVALSLVPGIGANATLLRTVRVLRVIRLFEAINDLKVIVKGLLRSLAPLVGVAGLVVVITYIYAVVGTALFGERLPGEWGDVGVAMLTCFRVLTLDNWDDIFFPAQEVTLWAVPFFLSYILVATFVVLNIVIAVVVSSVEEARRLELEENVEQVAADAAAEAPQLAERIAAVRVALDDLEAQLGSVAARSTPPAPHGPDGPHEPHGPDGPPPGDRGARG